MDHSFWLALAGIIGVDLLLSADNAMVIALVCRGLPARQRVAGMIAGTGVAIALRVGFALAAGYVLGWHGVGLLGGLYLLWVAIKLTAHGDEDPEVKPATSLGSAVLTIGMADLMMSWDNIAAVVGLSGGDNLLVAAGVLISIPMIVAGAVAIMWMLKKAPWLLWLGALLLGGIAGKVAAHDPLALQYTADVATPDQLKWACIGAGVLITGTVAAILAWRRGRLDDAVDEIFDAI